MAWPFRDGHDPRIDPNTGKFGLSVSRLAQIVVDNLNDAERRYKAREITAAEYRAKVVDEERYFSRLKSSGNIREGDPNDQLIWPALEHNLVFSLKEREAGQADRCYGDEPVKMDEPGVHPFEVPPVGIDEFGKYIAEEFGKATQGVTGPLKDVLDLLNRIAMGLAGLVDAVGWLKDIGEAVSEAKELAKRAEDASGAPIPAENLDPGLVARMAALGNIPIAGGIIKGLVASAKMAEYQQRIGRGFASKIDQLDFALNSSGFQGAFNGVIPVGSQIPAWFSENIRRRKGKGFQRSLKGFQ